MSTNPKLKIKDGKVYATSIDIADYFERGHREVLRSIRNILPHLSTEFSLLNFEQVYGAKLHHKRTEIYELTRNGFAMIALGFTGDKAIKFREAYITRFDEIEAELRSKKFHSTQDTQLKLFPEFAGELADARPAMPIRFAYQQMIRQGVPSVTPATLRKMIKRGDLEGYKQSGFWYIYDHSFAAFLQERKF